MVRRARVVSVLVVLGVALLSGRCASDRSLPTGITPDLSAQSTPSGLLQCSKLPSTSLKQTIGSAGGTRSEEHTSEHLVCRLLLEKKKHNQTTASNEQP